MKKAIVFFLSFLLALSVLIPSASAASFKDVSVNYRFFNEINYLSGKSIISGYSDGRFGPDDKVTRAQAAIMIGRSLKLDGTKRQTTFSDVDANNVASGYIDSAVKTGIITGFPDGSYRPNETVTRGQLAIFLARAFKLSDSAAVNFKDVSKNSAAYPFIGKIIAAGITAGYPDHTYRPNIAVARGQFAAFMSRSLNPVFIDNTKRPTLKVDFLNVGQGDAILIKFPNGKAMLVDAGRSDDEVKRELASLNISAIDTFVATHPDADHIGGANYVIENYKVKNVVDSGQEHTTQIYLDYLNAVKATGASFKVAQVGQNITLDSSVSVKVLYVNSHASDSNEGSIVLMVSYGESDYLLTGDTDTRVEALLVDQYDLDAEVLKASHHGSDTGTSQALVNEVKPDYGVLSYGENNQYGHPKSVVVNRLKNIGAHIVSTPNGQIQTWTDGSYVFMKQVPSAPVQNSVPAPKPKPTPEPVPAPTPAPTPTKFQNCTEMRKVYPDGVKKGHPAYESKHDRDNDGWACERS
ncbi:S-layer homology domain-containing protein [Pseudobacillus sp. FSL P4-0506]|uniref:S-layer homology domain-containing protein n=1 Tax=Pseudobacillus sp. FSL P4-0506 TaxID=2921576 RepID=UPI0030F5ACA9